MKLVRVFELVGRNVNVVSQEGPGLLGDHDPDSLVRFAEVMDTW